MADSFTEYVSGSAVDDNQDVNTRLVDSRYLVDLNDFDENELFFADNQRASEVYGNPTYGDMKNYALTTLKGLNTYWLKESAKLIYDSYGLDFDGKTIEIKLAQQGNFMSACYTTANKIDDLPKDTAVIGFSIANLDENNPNGLITFENKEPNFYDRIVVHEMVHAAMFIDGTLKPLGMPQFFFEGIADLIQGDDDAIAGQTETIKNFFEKQIKMTR